jgi:hypothetical protein
MMISSKDDNPDGKESREVTVIMLRQLAVMDAMYLWPIDQPAQPAQTEFEIGMDKERPGRKAKPIAPPARGERSGFL